MGEAAAGFDGIVCVDAMENLPPEGWPTVLRSFHGALRSSGPLYFTAETAADEGTGVAFAAGEEIGLPLARGEWPREGGYHYYPRLAAVRERSEGASFRKAVETSGDGRHHFLFCRLPTPAV